MRKTRKKLTKLQFEKAIAKCTSMLKENKKVAREVILNDKSMAEVARKYGKTGSSVSQTISLVYKRHNQIKASKNKEPLKAVKLSKRQLDVLRLLNQGMTNQDIADNLGISVYTVKHHVNTSLEILNVRNRTQALLESQRLRIK